MRRFCTTSDTCRHKIGNTSGGERKVCTLNAKETAGVENRKEAVKNLVQLLRVLDDIDDSPERESNKEKGVCDDGVVVVF